MAASIRLYRLPDCSVWDMGYRKVHMDLRHVLSEPSMVNGSGRTGSFAPGKSQGRPLGRWRQWIQSVQGVVIFSRQSRSGKER